MATTYLGRGASTYYTTGPGGVGLGSEIVTLINSKIDDCQKSQKIERHNMWKPPR